MNCACRINIINWPANNQPINMYVLSLVVAAMNFEIGVRLEHLNSLIEAYERTGEQNEKERKNFMNKN